MVEAMERIDELLKDYFLFRGMTSTFKAFETDLKNDKERSFRADKIKDQIHLYIQNSDLNGLRGLWKHLERRIFSHLEYTHSPNVRRIEISLLRLYVVTAVQFGRTDKVTEFFDKMCYEIQTQPEWKEWFALPFVKNPEQSQMFEAYFSKQWQDTLIFSLQNFLSIIFQSMPLPTLLSFDAEQLRMKSLIDENNRLHSQLAEYEKPEPTSEIDASIPFPLATAEIPDDFASISGRHQVREFGTRPSAPKIGSRRSPLISRKQVGNTEKNHKGATSTSNLGNISKSVGFNPGAKLGAILGQRKGGDTSAAGKSKDPGQRRVESASLENTSVLASGVANQPKPATVKPSYEAQRKELFHKSSSAPTPRGDKGAVPRPTNEKHLELQEMAQPEIAAVISAVKKTPGPYQVISPFIVLSSDEYTEHHSSISHCKFSPTATAVATMDIDGVVKVWSFSPMPMTIATVMFKAPLISLEWVPKQPRMLLLGSSDGILKLYDTEQKKTLTDVSVDPSCPKIVSLACNPVGDVFAASQTSQERSGVITDGGRSRLLLWDVKVMKPQREFNMGEAQTCVNSMAFNHNGNMMITGSSDGHLRLFDVNTCDCILKWKAHNGPVHAVNFSPDENSLFSMGADGKFCQCAIFKPDQQVDFGIHQGATGPFERSGFGGYKQQQFPTGKLFAFDSSGQYILTCAPYGGIIYQLCKPGRLDQMLTILGHKAPVVSVDWSTSVNTGMCLTGSMDGKVQVTTLLSQ